MQVRHW